MSHARRLTILWSMTVACALFAGVAPVYADNNGLTSLVIPRDTIAYGHQYGDWAAAWWQWALSIPANAHPLLDSADCNTGQSGPVFFIGGSFQSRNVTRKCTVPAGKSLFFPLINEVSTSFPPPLVQINDQRIFDAQVLDGAGNLHVDLDGKQLKAINPGFRSQSIAFDVTLPDNNLFQIAAGAYSTSTDDGYYILLKPLKPGQHTLHFTATNENSLTFDVVYELTQN